MYHFFYILFISIIIYIITSCTQARNDEQKNKKKCRVSNKADGKDKIEKVKVAGPLNAENFQASQKNILNNFNIRIRNHISRYDLLKDEISEQQDKYFNNYKNAASDTDRKVITENATHYIISTITEKIFPFWYGTKWDFEGITETPLKGEIACGYFISTIMKHAGFNIERYKLAQQDAKSIIKTLCKHETIRSFSDINTYRNYLLNGPDGLYITGLDCHVGFIYKTGNSLFFIHSNYGYPQEVIKEDFDESVVLHYSNSFYTGNISDNDNLIGKWINKENIPTFIP